MKRLVTNSIKAYK